MNDFVSFPKIPRLTSKYIITEKIDGTNAQINITFQKEYGDKYLHTELTEIGPVYVYAGSRNRVLTVEKDNFGFAKWVQENAQELARALGPGRHFGEWWGKGINRGYGLDHKRFSLFNTTRWNRELPDPLDVVPVLSVCGSEEWDTRELNEQIEFAGERLRTYGSYAAPGYMDPEGLVVLHARSNQLFKVPFNK